MTAPTTLQTLRELARPTDRCVTTAALIGAGFSRRQIRTLASNRAIRPIVRACWIAGEDNLTARQLCRAGLLVGGATSMLAGRTAAEHLGLLPATAHEVDVLVAATTRKRRSMKTQLPFEVSGLEAGITIRTTRRTVEPRVHAGLPVAPIAQVLRELARSEGGEVLTAAWREADFLQVLDPGAIQAEIATQRPGARLLSAMARAQPLVQTDETRAQTKAEFLLIEALLALGVPRPVSNMPMQVGHRWYYPDLWWKLLRAVVEVDGPYHRNRQRAVEDELRDEDMAAHGLALMRVERDAVLADPQRVARQVFDWLRSLPTFDAFAPAAQPVG